MWKGNSFGDWYFYKYSVSFANREHCLFFRPRMPQFHSATESDFSSSLMIACLLAFGYCILLEWNYESLIPGVFLIVWHTIARWACADALLPSPVPHLDMKFTRSALHRCIVCDWLRSSVCGFSMRLISWCIFSFNAWACSISPRVVKFSSRFLYKALSDKAKTVF